MGSRSKAKLSRDRDRWTPMVTTKGRLPSYSRAEWRAKKAKQLNYTKDLEERCANIVKDKVVRLVKQVDGGFLAKADAYDIESRRMRNRRRRMRQGRLRGAL